MEIHANSEEAQISFNSPRPRPKRERRCTAEPSWRRTAVKTRSLVMLLLLFVPTAAMAQRYGRPYSLTERPSFFLQITVEKKSHYLHAADLRKMRRSIVTQIDPATKASHVYEGVALEELVPSGILSGDESIEIEFGSHQTRIISGRDLNTSTKLIVADTVDGKTPSGDAPYDFVVQSDDQPLVAISDVQRITLRSVTF